MACNAASSIGGVYSFILRRFGGVARVPAEPVAPALWSPIPKVDKLIRLPVGVSMRLMTWIGRVEVTNSCHLPVPSPKRPCNPPRPFSRSWAVTVVASLARSDRRTRPLGGAAPPSSTPSIVTSTVLSLGLISRSKLRC